MRHKVGMSQMRMRSGSRVAAEWHRSQGRAGLGAAPNPVRARPGRDPGSVARFSSVAAARRVWQSFKARAGQRQRLIERPRLRRYKLFKIHASCHFFSRVSDPALAAFRLRLWFKAFALVVWFTPGIWLSCLGFRGERRIWEVLKSS